MSSTMSFQIAYSLFHWMTGDISPEELAPNKHRRTSSSASVSSAASLDRESIEIGAFADAQRDNSSRHRRVNSDGSRKSVRFV